MKYSVPKDWDGADTYLETGMEIVYFEEKIFCTGPTIEQRRLNKNLLSRHDKEPTKEGPLSFVLSGSPLTSVSTVSRGHPSLRSLSGEEGGQRKILLWWSRKSEGFSVKKDIE